MKIEEIKKVVQTINSSNIYELLKENNLNVVYSDILNNRKLDATL
ncbi:MAG: hypothetical protein RR916_06160 [Anaerorhabdus sp.]